MAKRYTAVYEKRGNWYIGYVQGLPGANTQGRTLPEVKANLREALNLILEVKKQLLREKEPPTKVLREPVKL